LKLLLLNSIFQVYPKEGATDGSPFTRVKCMEKIITISFIWAGVIELPKPILEL